MRLPPVILDLGGGLVLALVVAPLVLLVLRWRRRPELPTPALLLTKLDTPGGLARLHLLAWAPDARAPLPVCTGSLPAYRSTPARTATPWAPA